MNLSVGRVIWWAILALIVAGLVYTGFWHLFTFFIWAHPMLSWLPIAAFYVVGLIVGLIQRGLRSAQTSEAAPSPAAATGDAGRLSLVMGSLASASGASLRAAAPPRRIPFAAGWGLATGLLLLLVGLWFTLISKPALGLDQIHYSVITQLPDQSEPRLLPRSGIDDDPGFRDADEIHLIRSPETGKLLWTGEWRGSWTGSESHGIVVQPLDDITHRSRVTRAGFAKSIGGITPGTMMGKAYIKHPFSRIQYPITVPLANGKVGAIAPYMGYHGFPFEYPTLKGVLVYDTDGNLEDLTPEEAAARPDLAATGRLVPEKVARSEAEALSRSDEFKGDIDDGEDNKQPYLTAIDKDTTDWVTIIDNENANAGVRAVVLTDSTTGDTSVWVPPKGQRLISSEQVVDTARALPLQFTATRCCDSDGDSYTVTLRQVVEPRLAFRNGHPYYMVSVVPTDDLVLSREIEYTLVIDAETGKTIHKYDHVSDPSADAKLQAFFGG
jgi:uncharacterized membrane protein YkoI